MEIKLDQLNHDYLSAIDKLYRQFAGLSSTLTDFKDNTLYLQIQTSARWPKDPFTTALQISQSWRDFRPVLNAATHYRVELRILQAGADTGGIIPNLTDPEALNKSIQKTKKAMRLADENFSIVILSGPIDAPMNAYWTRNRDRSV